MLAQPLREIKVLCEPANTPDSIDIDVSNLKAGESIHVSDLKVGHGIEIHEDPQAVVATVTIVKEASLEPQVVEGAEPEVEGATPEAPAEGEE
jgi:large subunit ribosomal protein L25